LSELNPIHLAQAIVHWLEYQSICGRSELFCEAYLSQPVGEYCLSIRPEHFAPEYSYPTQFQGKRKGGRLRSLDFAVFRQQANAAQKYMSDAVETKFVTANRDFTQEVFDDLYRLLWFQSTREPERCRRWFVTAGFRKNLEGDNFLSSKVQLGRGANKPQKYAFRGLLSTDLNNHTRTKQIHTGAAQLRSRWVKAAHNFGQTQVPNSITVRLAGRSPKVAKPTDACCYVWEVVRPQPDFQSVHPC